MQRKIGIIFLSLFILMAGVGIFTIGASAHHGSSGCALNALFGDCVPTDDILAVVNHHSTPYQSLGESQSWRLVLTLGLLLIWGWLVLDKRKKDVGWFYQVGEERLRFFGNTFNWRSRFLGWLVFKRSGEFA